MEDPLVFALARWVRIVALGVLAVPVALLCVSARAGSPEGLLFGFLFSVPVAFLNLGFGFSRWRVDEQGVEHVSPVTRRNIIAWDDVIVVEEGKYGAILLRGGAHGVRIPSVAAGIQAARRRVLSRLAGVLSENTRGALERRLGVPSALTSVPVAAPEAPPDPRERALARLRDNPFFVLGLDPECSRAEVERVGQKLLALLAVGSTPAKKYESPFGEAERTEEAVRAAMAELRDPERRLVHEVWARAGTMPAAGVTGEDVARPWAEAMRAIGWGPR